MGVSSISELGVLVHPLTYVRKTRDWSEQRTAEVIRDHSGVNMAANRNKVWRWEHWGVAPDRISQLALAKALDVPADELDRHPWPAWLPAWDDFPVGIPWTRVGSLGLLSDAVEACLRDRRGFMGVTGTALTGLAVDWTTIDPGKLIAVAKGGQVDDEFVTWFESRIPGLRRMDDRLGGKDLHSVVHAELGFATNLLKSSSFTSGTVGRRLYAVAGELAQLAGWVAFDAGLHSAAQRYWQAGLHAAHTAGDRPLGALILSCLSWQATQVGDAGDAVDLAEHAVTGAKDAATATTKAMLEVRLAFAYARASQASECEQALDEARNAFVASDTAADPSWTYWFSEARLPEFAGHCYLELNKAEQAVPAITDALVKYDESYVRDRILNLVWLAQAELLRSEVEQAAQYGQQALTLVAGVSSTYCLGQLCALRNQLVPHQKSVPAVRDFEEQHTALIA